MYLFIHQRFLVQYGRVVALIFPRGDVREMLVISLRLAVGSLMLFAEMSAAGFIASQRVQHKQLRKLHEIRNTTGILERLIQFVPIAEHIDSLPELLSQTGNRLKSLSQPCLVAAHPALVPHQLAEFSMKLGYCSIAFDR